MARIMQKVLSDFVSQHPLLACTGLFSPRAIIGSLRAGGMGC